MQLSGSCSCGKVEFSFESHTPQPFMRCYCSICRKTAGGGGYAINIMGLADSLKVTGEEFVKIYRARLAPPAEVEADGLSPSRRHFCGECGSALWAWDPRWAQWFYPFASAIDSTLPRPPMAERVHLMLEFAAPWAAVPSTGKQFPGYPEEAIADWHHRLGLWVE